MGLRDELRKSLDSARLVAEEAAQAGARAFNSWAEERATTSRMNRIDEEIEKAATRAKAAGKDGTHEFSDDDTKAATQRERKSLHFDPFDIVAAMGYRDRPSTVTYQTMEMCGLSVPVIADVVTTRINQVIMFCDRPEDRHSAGLKVRPRDWRTQSITPAIEKRCAELEDLLLHTGEYNKNDPSDSVSLTDFTKMFIRDSLTYDQGCFETVPTEKGDRPSYFSIVDGSTVRLLDPGYRDPGDPFAVQVVSGSIVTDFTHEELAFCVRNPRSGIRSYGYGTSEVETLVREITGFLWGMDYNRRFFSQGAATRGLINFKGTMPDDKMRAFRRLWYAQVSGVTNAWRTPIINSEDVQWINMQMSNRDMEYNAWIDFLIKIVCARYQIAPEEVNFSYGNTGQSQAMGQAPIEEKLKASRDLGLRPLVRWYFQQLNAHYIQRVDPDFEVVPVGLDERGADAEAELLGKQQANFLTLDEAREAAGLPPLGEDGGGKVIMNPTWLQWFNANQAQQQMGGMGDDPNEPNGGDTGGLDVEHEMHIDDTGDGDQGDWGGGGGQDDDAQADDDSFDPDDQPALKSERDRRTVRYTQSIS
jgi:hypothetical protein